MQSALRERLRAGKIDPATGKPDGQDRLNEFVEYATKRLEDLRSVRNNFFDARLQKFAEIAASEYKHRLARQLGTDGVPLAQLDADNSIFLRSNLPLQLVRGIKKFLLARGWKDLFGSRPWLSATPRKPTTQAEASEIQRHAEYKLMEARWQEKARGVLDTVLSLGFCFVKTAWSERWDVSEKLQSILHDPETKEPVTTSTGDYVFPEDDTQEVAEGPQPDGEEQAEGEPAPAAPRVFAKDPTIPVPDGKNGLSFKPHVITDKERLFCGLDFSPLHWKDVVWPINAAELDLGRGDCDFIAVTRDMTLSEIRLAYDPDGTNKEIQELLESLKGEQVIPQSEGAKPKTERNEPQVNGSDSNNPTIKITECYFRRSVIEPGPESRIFMVLAEKHRKAIWLDYLAASSPRGQAPVHVVAVNQEPGRAYGIGLYELFEKPAEMLDRLINCIIVRNEYHANPEQYVDSKIEGAIGGDKTLTRSPGVKQSIENRTGVPLRDLFYTQELPDADERTWQLTELLMQLMQLESGVTNASQGDMSDLPSNSTATGINSTLESSSVLHQYGLGEMRDGLTPALRYGIELLYFRQDCDEVYDYLGGDSAALEQVAQAEAIVAQGPGQDDATAQPEQPAPPGQPARQPGVMTYAQAQTLANLPMNVEILLSRAKQQEQRAAMLATIPMQQNFFALPPQVQKYALPLHLMAFAANGVENPDQYFPSATDIQAAITAQQSSAGNKTPDERIQLREQLNYKDTPPSIQRQMEAEAGYTPASPDESAPAQSGAPGPAQAPGAAPAGSSGSAAQPPATSPADQPAAA